MLRQFGYMAALLMGGGASLDAVANDSGAVSQKVYQISDTQSVRLAGVDAVTITIGEAASLVVNERKNRFDSIKVKSDANRLSISADDGGWFSSRDYTAIITLPALSSLQAAGSIKGVVSGVDSEVFELDLAGSAQMMLSGKCTQLSVDAAGRVNLDASKLRCEVVRVDAAGLTDIQVYASVSLDVDAAGATDVIYHGNPAKIDSDLSGAGSVEAAAKNGR